MRQIHSLFTNERYAVGLLLFFFFFFSFFFFFFLGGEGGELLFLNTHFIVPHVYILPGLGTGAGGIKSKHLACICSSAHLSVKLTLKVLVTTIDALGPLKQDNYSTVGGDGGCRIGEVRAGTTSPRPDHKGFMLQ